MSFSFKLNEQFCSIDVFACVCLCVCVSVPVWATKHPRVLNYLNPKSEKVQSPDGAAIVQM